MVLKDVATELPLGLSRSTAENGFLSQLKTSTTTKENTVLIIHAIPCPVMTNSAQIYPDGIPLLIPVPTNILIFVLFWCQPEEEIARTGVKVKVSNAIMHKTTKTDVSWMTLMTGKPRKETDVCSHGVTRFVLVESLNQKNLGIMSHGHSIHLLCMLLHSHLIPTSLTT